MELVYCCFELTTMALLQVTFLSCATVPTNPCLNLIPILTFPANPSPKSNDQTAKLIANFSWLLLLHNSDHFLHSPPSFFSLILPPPSFLSSLLLPPFFPPSSLLSFLPPPVCYSSRMWGSTCSRLGSPPWRWSPTNSSVCGRRWQTPHRWSSLILRTLPTRFEDPLPPILPSWILHQKW